MYIINRHIGVKWVFIVLLIMSLGTLNGAPPCDGGEPFTPVELRSEPEGYPKLNKRLYEMFSNAEYDLNVELKVKVRILANGKTWDPELDEQGITILNEDELQSILPNQAAGIIEEKDSILESFGSYSIEKTSELEFQGAFCGENEVFSDISLLFIFFQADEEVTIEIEEI